MRLLRDIPIQRKLTLISLVTSVTALAIACAAFALYEQFAFRRTMTRDLAIIAQLIGANTAADLSFNDVRSAEQTLAGLRAQPHIVAACLYTAEGAVFAVYRRNPSAAVRWPARRADSEQFGDDALELFRRIDLAGEPIGTIYLVSDLAEMRARWWRYAGIALAVIIGATFVASFAGSRLQRLVTGPVSQLVAAAARVAAAKDYSVRAVKRSNDELGRLIDVFNDMLAQIESRDTDLETRVAARTHELQTENEERRRAETSLADSLSVLHATLESTADGILVVDREGRLTNFNRKFTEMWRIPAEILAKRDDAQTLAFVMDQLVDPDGFLRKVRELYADPTAESFDVLAFRDGRLFERFSQPQRVRGVTAGRVWCFRDITQRVRAEDRLIMLGAALHAAPNSIMITDANGVIEWVNPTFTRETGYTLAEAVGQNPRLLSSGRQSREYYAEMWRTIAGGQSWHGEFVNKRKSGELYSEEATIAPVRDAAGAIRHYVAIKLDVTARKALEAQLRQAQKMEIVGQLAGGVAHDFNNILTAMLLNLEMLSARQTMPPHAAQPLSDLQAMTRRAARLTEQLLLFARKHVMRTEQLELNTLLASLIKMLRRLLGEHLTVNLVSNVQPLWIEADAGMLDQVVMNLCVNARDAMPSGGQLTLEARLVTIDPDSAKLDAEARPGWFACLRVSDTGTGMSPEVLAHAFEPFYTTKGAGKGTGLGLATVHGIVHQHNGWINVESAAGQGTTFRIYLPLSTRAAPAEQVAAPGAIPRGSETILLVEDEESVRRVTAKMLERLGYRVLVAGGGQEALQLWERHMAEIDLLFSDMVMPNGISGLDLAQKLQQAKPALKVIIVSGYSRDIVSKDALRASGIVFLGKPFESNTLATALRECLA